MDRPVFHTCWWIVLLGPGWPLLEAFQFLFGAVVESLALGQCVLMHVWLSTRKPSSRSAVSCTAS